MDYTGPFIESLQSQLKDAREKMKKLEDELEEKRDENVLLRERVARFEALLEARSAVATPRVKSGPGGCNDPVAVINWLNDYNRVRNSSHANDELVPAPIRDGESEDDFLARVLPVYQFYSANSNSLNGFIWFDDRTFDSLADRLAARVGSPTETATGLEFIKKYLLYNGSDIKPKPEQVRLMKEAAENKLTGRQWQAAIHCLSIKVCNRQRTFTKKGVKTPGPAIVEALETPNPFRMGAREPVGEPEEAFEQEAGEAGSALIIYN
jgi:hypothetical protein